MLSGSFKEQIGGILEEISKWEKWLEDTYNIAWRDEENVLAMLRDLENGGFKRHSLFEKEWTQTGKMGYFRKECLRS